MSQEEESFLDPDRPDPPAVPPAEGAIARVSPAYWYSGYVLFDHELDEDELWHVLGAIEEYLDIDETTGKPRRGLVDFLKGQFETSATGQIHFQYIMHFPKKVRPYLFLTHGRRCVPLLFSNGGRAFLMSLLFVNRRWPTSLLCWTT